MGVSGLLKDHLVNIVGEIRGLFFEVSIIAVWSVS